MGTGRVVELVTMIWIGCPRNPVRFLAVPRGHFSADFRPKLTSNELSVQCVKELNSPGLKQQKALDDHSCHLISKLGMTGALPHVLHRDILFC